MFGGFYLLGPPSFFKEVIVTRLMYICNVTAVAPRSSIEGDLFFSVVGKPTEERSDDWNYMFELIDNDSGNDWEVGYGVKIAAMCHRLPHLFFPKSHFQIFEY